MNPVEKDYSPAVRARIEINEHRMAAYRAQLEAESLTRKGMAVASASKLLLVEHHLGMARLLEQEIG